MRDNAGIRLAGGGWNAGSAGNWTCLSLVVVEGLLEYPCENKSVAA